MPLAMSCTFLNRTLLRALPYTEALKNKVACCRLLDGVLYPSPLQEACTEVHSPNHLVLVRRHPKARQPEKLQTLSQNRALQLRDKRSIFMVHGVGLYGP